MPGLTDIPEPNASREQIEPECRSQAQGHTGRVVFHRRPASPSNRKSLGICKKIREPLQHLQISTELPLVATECPG